MISNVTFIYPIATPAAFEANTNEAIKLYQTLMFYNPINDIIRFDTCSDHHVSTANR